MTFDRLAAALIVALLASVGAMTYGAAWQYREVSALAAALFAILCVAAAVFVNRPFWTDAPSSPNFDRAKLALWQSTLLITIAYVWGALAFMLIYRASGLYWRHGLQYGIALALLAMVHANLVRRLARATDQPATAAIIDHAVKLAAVQGVAVAVGLLWLVGSGKLSTLKSDWAANHIFLSGGFAVLCLTAIIVKTHASLTRP